jgi:putative nucleotidyltransferase with HDIG domain
MGTMQDWRNLVPLLMASAVDACVNLILLIGVISLQTGRRALEIWRVDFQWAVPITMIGNVLGGGVLALGYEIDHLLGLGVFLLPVVATSYSFSLYISKMKENVEKLEEANRKLDESNRGLYQVIAALVDIYDVYTSGHSKQVASYAEAIAIKLGLSADAQERVRKAAFVHDVGKIAIPDAILGKRGRLTDAEYDDMKSHPVIGADILKDVKGLRELEKLVRHHHERWDGTGYPDGLKEEEIPLETRILTVADALEAILSKRPYREGRSLREAVCEIKRSSGTQFDPLVVKALIEVINEKDRLFFVNTAEDIESHFVITGKKRITKGSRYLKGERWLEELD